MRMMQHWCARFFALARTYDFLIFYALSIALGRGLSIFVLPLTSRFIEPQDYARLDVAASIIEITGLVASFALSDLIFRFAAKAATPQEQNEIASQILGVGLICALATLLAAEVLMPVFAATLSVGVSEWALRAGLAGAACGGLVELPLAWLRLRDRPRAYLGFIALRSLTQIGLMIAVLAQGYGPEGVLVSNACIEGGLVAVLIVLQIREFGLTFSRTMLRNALHYSTPIVFGSFAMFGLGSCDRFFLAGAVPAAELARYTLAGKLAFAAPLLLQPFALWWNPRRIAVLGEAGGIERSRRIVGYGFFVLFVSCSVTILCGSLFIKLALPPAYIEAARYLPFLVLITGLNEFATLVNVGSFARPHGRELLYVNGAGGVVAVLGYCLLVPAIGIAGAIAATVVGHALRVALFIMFGRTHAPIAYPVLGIGVMAASLAALIAVKPATGGWLTELGFLPLSLAVLWLEAQFFGMVPRLRLSRRRHPSIRPSKLNRTKTNLPYGRPVVSMNGSSMASMFQLRQWIKAGQNPLARAIYRMVLGSRTFSMPLIPFVHRPLYQLRGLVLYGTEEALRIFWYTPLFQSRLEAPAKRLNLWNGIPVVVGSLRITMGEDCCICGQSTYTGRTVGKEVPQLVFGRNIGIGWQTTISVGTKVVIGDNVRISGRALLSGYPGHPINAAARARHLPDTDDQIGDIILEDDVWLGTGCTVSAGVTIGRGTIVAANSTVTKSLPPYVLAAGSPAIIKRSIAPHEANAEMRQALAEATGIEPERRSARDPAADTKTAKTKTAKLKAATSKTTTTKTTKDEAA